MQRYRGYCAALERHAIAVDPGLQVSVSFLPEGGVQGVLEMERRGQPFDAVFACSDLLAMTAIDTLRTHGVRVPDDVAVIGYDDIAQAALFYPRLTTVRQPLAAAAETMVASLLSLIDGGPVRSVELPTELSIRASGGELLA